MLNGWENVRLANEGRVSRCGSCHRRGCGDSCPHCGAVYAHAVAPHCHTPDVGGFRNLEVLGHGGFATAYRAMHPTHGRCVLKVAHDADDKRFAREAHALRACPAGIAPSFIDDVYDERGAPVLVMEELSGAPLAAHLAAHWGKLDRLLPLLRSLASALDRLHEHGWVHCDVKPENVMVDEEGRCRLLDFGLAKPASTAFDAPDLTVTQTGHHAGTPYYMAPEQMDAHQVVGPETDRYALAVIAFEAATGRPPFVGESGSIAIEHATQRPPSVTTVANLGGAIDVPLAAGLAKRPEDRPLSCETFIASLQALRSLPPAAKPRQTAGGPGAKESLVAIAWLSPAPSLPQAVSAANEIGGVLCGEAGDGLMVAFPGAHAAEGVRAARGLLSQLPATHAFVHVASVQSRPGRRGTRLLGSAIHSPTSWLPATPSDHHHGTWLSRNAATVTEAPEASQPGPWVQAQEFGGLTNEGHLPLIGRDGVLSELEDILARARRDSTSTIVCLQGERGVGRSRLLDAFRPLDAKVLRLSSSKEADETLLRIGLHVTDTATAADVRAAVHQLLGDGASAAAAAAQFTLGVADETQPDIARLLSMPGSVSQNLSWLIGAGLSRLADGTLLVLLIDDADALSPGVLGGLAQPCHQPGTSIVTVLAVASDPSPASQLQRLHVTPQTVDLTPLDRAQSHELLRELLRPAEHIPGEHLDRLAELCRGVPRLALELVDSLKRSGIFRPRPSGRGWLLAGDELAHASATPLVRRLTERRLQKLNPRLRSLAGVCAVMGAPVRPAEVGFVVDALGARCPAFELDIRVALTTLCSERILREGTGGFRFTGPLLERAISEQVAAPERRCIHEALCDYLIEQGEESEQLAAHAAACDRNELATRLYLQFANRAAYRHDYTGAETLYAAALRTVSDKKTTLQALRGRALMRSRLARTQDARRDLERALELADDLGIADDIASMMLELATLSDLEGDFDEAARLLAKARTAAPAPPYAASLRIALTLATGRDFMRRARWAEAVDALSEAADAAASSGDAEAEIQARLMLGWGQAELGERTSAEETLATALAVCRQVGNRLDLGGLHINRSIHWALVHDAVRSREDAEQGIQVARQIGNVALELVGQHNLAELCLFRGDLEGARSHGARALELTARLGGEPGRIHLLLARIASHRGDGATTQEHLGHLDTPALSPDEQMLFASVGLRLRADSLGDWQTLVDQRPPSAHDFVSLELLQGFAHAANAAGQAELAAGAVAKVLEEIPEHSFWRPRFNC